jgi:hypothetical protein
MDLLDGIELADFQQRALAPHRSHRARVDHYNSCDGSFSQKSMGHLTAVNLHIGDETQTCVYQYSYNQASPSG